MRASSQSELIRITFSVMLSIVRLRKGGILTREGSILSFSSSFRYLVLRISDGVGYRCAMSIQIYKNDINRKDRVGLPRLEHIRS